MATCWGKLLGQTAGANCWGKLLGPGSPASRRKTAPCSTVSACWCTRAGRIEGGARGWAGQASGRCGGPSAAPAGLSRRAHHPWRSPPRPAPERGPFRLARKVAEGQSDCAGRRSTSAQEEPGHGWTGRAVSDTIGFGAGDRSGARREFSIRGVLRLAARQL